jgi:CRISPR-associated protein Csb2
VTTSTLSTPARHLLVSITLLDRLFHGRADGDEPEWPPSPMRVFQAMLAGGAAASRASGGLAQADLEALRWLERQSAPLIVAPAVRRCRAYRLSVPNNAMDVVASAWARGNESGQGDANPATHRSMKMVTPIALESGDTVYYVWQIPAAQSPNAAENVEALKRLVHAVVAFGWGIDLAYGSATVVGDSAVASLAGEHWSPISQPAGVPLRVPTVGSLSALLERHERFTSRLGKGGAFTPTPALTRFRRCHYARLSDAPGRPFSAFQLLSTTEGQFRSFRATQVAKVAAMIRHCVGTLASATKRTDVGVSPDEWLDRYVHGHDRGGCQPSGRFAYVPLPTIDPRGVVDRVRRVIVAEPLDGAGLNARWAGQVLVGQPLTNEQSQKVEATLAACPVSDYVLGRYARAARCWATVTPIVLPWGDSGKPQRATKQFLKAVRHAGYRPEDVASVELRREPFWRGVEVASRYFVPKHLRGTAVWHVLLEWKEPVEGPVVIGSGRFYGLGLFAAVDG